MWGMFYQIIKDLFQGAGDRAIAGFSAKQIDRTIEQICLASQLEVERLKAATEKEKLRESQEDHKYRLERAGGLYYQVTCLDDVIEIVSKRRFRA